MTYWERLLAEYVGGGDSPISPTLIAKSITTNGTYNAVDDEADGYSSVSVNVPNTSTLKGNLPLTFKTSEEQLRDWTIYGNDYEHTYSATGTLPLTFTTHTAGAASDWQIEGNNNTGKNKFETPNISESWYAVKWSVENGVLKGVGTYNDNAAHTRPRLQGQLPAGSYILSGSPDYTATGIRLQIGTCTDSQGTNFANLGYDEGSGFSFTLQTDSWVSVRVLTSATLYQQAIDVLIPIMIRPADTSADFEPYQVGVGQRTKNYVTWDNVDDTQYNVHCYGENGYLRLVGTYQSDGVHQPFRTYFQLPAGSYVLSGAPDYDTLPIRLAMCTYVGSVSNYTTVGYDSGNGLSFTLTEDSDCFVAVRLQSGVIGVPIDLTLPCMVRPANTTADFIPMGYEVPLTISQTGQTSKNYDIYIGDSPLTEGQTISNIQEIEVFEGANTISTDLYNKPSMSITGVDYVGVGEPVNDGWQIPLTVSDGTNTTTVNVPIEAPLTSTDSVSGVVDIPTYVGTNTIDTTLVEPVTADIVYVGANSTLINKTVNQNGTYFAYSDNANGYNSVAVDVPNTYTNEDESKVVSNGELVAQTTTSVTTNGIVDTTTISSVSVNVPTAGSVTGDVRFLDYDGTVVQAYSKSDFASLTALPANPTHEGLTAQGWNWSLEDAKTYVAAYDKLDIGQMYITNDGKTRLYVTLDDGRRNPTLAIAVNGSCDVDWGDGTTHDTLTGTSLSSRVAVSHTYATGGDYVIALTVTGSFAFVGGSDGSLLLTYNNTGNDNRTKGYRNILRGVEIGDGITTIDRYAFTNCLTLSNITIPDSVISIEDNVFNTCIALSSITIPDNVESVAAYTFDSCYSLSSVTIPNSVTLIGDTAFRYCYSLSSVTIPNSVTLIGGTAFRYCYSLSSVTIPNSVTEIGTYAFDSCYSLSSVTIPNGVTTIEGSVFGICRTLVGVTIPNSVTSISAYAFSGCATLPSITIPASVTSMGGNVFASCGSLSSIVFQSETPPTISSSSAFYNVPTDCIIYVPTGTLADYTSASNYPSSSSYTYVEY